MTLLFFDGFESADLVQKPEWDTASSWSAQVGRSAGAAAPATNTIKTLTLPTAAAVCYLGVAFRMNNNSPLGNSAPGWMMFRTAAADVCSITLDATGHLQVRSGGAGGTVVATGTMTFAPLIWHQLQIRLVLNTTAGSIQIRVNGATTPDINFTGALSTATGSVAAVRLGAASSTSTSMWYDDLYVCDAVDATATQGRPNNDFLGDLKVSQLVPSGAGDSTQWTPNTAVANWTTVDESPPNQTDYVSSSVSGQRDLYAMADLPNGGTVYGVRLGLYAQKSDVGASSVKPVLKEGVSGTVTSQTAIALGVSWASLWGTMLAVKAAGTAWSVADVNALQAGVEVL